MKPSNIAQAHTLSSLLVIAAAGVLATWAAWSTLIGTWLDTNRYGHGLPIALGAAVWFAVAARRASAGASHTTWSILPALFAAVAVWLVGYGGSSAIGIQLVTPLLMLLAIWFAHGWPMLRRVGAPILFLYFALPGWELLVPPLQALCVAVVEGTLRQIGVPVAIEGVVVQIAAGSFAVVEDCSGIRFLMISLAIAYLMTIVYRLSLKAALSLMAVAAALSIVGNWIRIIIVVLAGHFSDMQHYLVANEHASLGWAIFLAVIIAVAVIGARMSPAPEAPATSADTRAIEARASFAATVVALASLAMLPLAILYRSGLQPGELVETRLPVLQRSFAGPYPATDAWHPAYPTATVAKHVAYRGADGSVELFVAEYQTQKPGSELTHHSNRLADESWTVVDAGPARDIVAAEPLRMLRYVTPAGAEWLVTYVYVVGEFRTASSIAAQVAYGTLSWFGPVTSRVVIAATPCPTDCTDATARLGAFWHAAAPALLGEQAAIEHADYASEVRSR